MLSKIEHIKEYILKDIETNDLSSGDRISSRHKIMKKFGCARATVDAAVKQLVESGFLYTSRGSGTFVMDRAIKGIKNVFIIDDYRVKGGGLFGALSMRIAADIQSEKSTAIIHPNEVKLQVWKFLKSGAAVIWIRPSAEYLGVISYLKHARVPQLLIGRPYPGFNYITTDADYGIDKGIKWLKENGVKSIAFITSENNPLVPYIAERQIAFFKASIRYKLKMKEEWLCFSKDENPVNDINRIARIIFEGKEIPDGIFISNVSLVIPLLTLASNFNKEVNKDFRIVSFDEESSLRGMKGICMLRQQWGKMGRLAVEWVFKYALNFNLYIKKVEPLLIKEEKKKWGKK